MLSLEITIFTEVLPHAGPPYFSSSSPEDSFHPGNERADRLDREATVNSIPRTYPIPSSDFIPTIKKEIRELWQFRWDLELNNKMREITTSAHPWLYAHICPVN